VIQPGHDLGARQTGRVLLQVIGPGQRLAELPESPAFHQRDRTHGLAPFGQHVEQVFRAAAARNLVTAGLEHTRSSRKPEIGVQQIGWNLHTGGRGLACHVACRFSPLDRQIDQVGALFHGMLNPPERSAAHDQAQQDQAQQRTDQPFEKTQMKTPDANMDGPMMIIQP